MIEAANGVAPGELEISRLARQQSIPALIVHDRGDLAVPFADGHAVARAWPGARLYATEGLGHSRVLRDPAAVATVVRFLAGQQ